MADTGLAPVLVTDLELLRPSRQTAADQQTTDAAELPPGSALEFVTGPLFNYRNADRSSFSWVDLENWVSRWEMKVAAVAQRCADLLLDVGRTDEAIEVALHALSVVTTHTTLTETLNCALTPPTAIALRCNGSTRSTSTRWRRWDLDDAEASTTDSLSGIGCQAVRRLT